MAGDGAGLRWCREYLQHLVNDVFSSNGFWRILESDVRLRAYIEWFHDNDHKGFTGRQEA